MIASFSRHLGKASPVYLTPPTLLDKSSLLEILGSDSVSQNLSKSTTYPLFEPSIAELVDCWVRIATNRRFQRPSRHPYKENAPTPADPPRHWTTLSSSAQCSKKGGLRNAYSSLPTVAQGQQSIHLPPTYTRQIIQPPHTYRAKHTTSTHMQSKTYNIHTHTKQNIQHPHAYKARHIFHIPTDQSIRSTTSILPQTSCYKHVSQDIPLPTDTCYPNYSTRHTFSYGRLPAHTILANRIPVHMYWFLERHGHPKTLQHRYHSKAACHGRQDY